MPDRDWDTITLDQLEKNVGRKAPEPLRRLLASSDWQRFDGKQIDSPYDQPFRVAFLYDQLPALHGLTATGYYDSLPTLFPFCGLDPAQGRRFLAVDADQPHLPVLLFDEHEGYVPYAPSLDALLDKLA